MTSKRPHRLGAMRPLEQGWDEAYVDRSLYCFGVTAIQEGVMPTRPRNVDPRWIPPTKLFIFKQGEMPGKSRRPAPSTPMVRKAMKSAQQAAYFSQASHPPAPERRPALADPALHPRVHREDRAGRLQASRVITPSSASSSSSHSKEIHKLSHNVDHGVYRQQISKNQAPKDAIRANRILPMKHNVLVRHPHPGDVSASSAGTVDLGSSSHR